MSNKQIKYLVIGVVGIILLLILNPIELIPEGSRGLRFNFGKINEIIIDPGITFRLPIVQKIEEVPITPLVFEKKISVSSDGAITRDNQTIGSELKVFYKYTESKLIEMRSKYGRRRIEELVNASITESFKMVIGEYDIFKLPMSRDEISKKVLAAIQNKLTKYPVKITDVNLLNFDWSSAFDEQIATTMKRAQEVKQKEQELLIAEQEAQKMVKQAEAEKEAAKLRADAKALEGEGIRKYNQSVQANMALEIKLRQLEIDKIKANKWNGQYVPNNMYGPIPVNTTGGIKGK